MLNFATLLLMLSIGSVAELVHLYQRSASHNLWARQDKVCGSVPAGPNLCARSCGAGYEQCVFETSCYNPTVGQICCSDGQFCLAGTYCASSNGIPTCCDDGVPLAECGATITIGTIAPESLETSTIESPDPVTSSTSISESDTETLETTSYGSSPSTATLTEDRTTTPSATITYGNLTALSTSYSAAPTTPTVEVVLSAAGNMIGNNVGAVVALGFGALWI